jgi:hypothetical protein
MDAILATVANGGQGLLIDRVVGTNKSTTCIINEIILNSLTAALVNPPDRLPLRWIERIY